MNNLTIFKHEEFGQVRTILINNEPYFRASDIAKALGYDQPHKAIKRHCDSVTKRTVADSMGFEEQINFIPESDVYSLIICSRLPSAKKFKKWVTSEVLPSIRKTGSYLSTETVKKTLLNPDYIIQIATELKEEQNKRKQIEQKLQEAKPKLNYLEQILQSKSLVNINQIAKDYGYSARGFNQMLADKKIQYKTNGQWVLYAPYHNKGYTHSSTIDITHTDGTKTIAMHTMWTQKGRLFLYEILKSKGIIPLIEVCNYIYFKRKKANDI